MNRVDEVIKSMTGYGRHEEIVSGRNILVEIKSVNHRYFELSTRTSRGYTFLEDKLKNFISQKVSRGKIDVFVGIQTLEDENVEILVNHSLAVGYVTALRELRDRYSLNDDISVSTVCRYPDIFNVHKVVEDEEEILNSVLYVLDIALEKFIAMREKEGEILREDINLKVDSILKTVSKIEEKSPEIVAEYENRLRAKIEDVVSVMDIDNQRILTEIAIFADKVAVDEETVRLKSHFKQLEYMLNSDKSVGRKMDFIVQEMNREANTIGSKSINSDISHMVVDIKADIEKIREQIQNIE